jgi:SAM-dependent methyltransferase
MTQDAPIIELGPWLRSPPGRYLLAWEQAQIDRAVADLFGYHALQVGVPEIDGLRANRMPHRWVASEWLEVPEPMDPPPPADPKISTLSPPMPVALHCLPHALPFPNQSLDLVLLPHTLELSSDPHATLREVERVLMPEGRVVIVGFNSTSLWGLRQRMGRVRHGLRIGSGPLFLPRTGDFIGYWRLRDWLRLLGMDLERGRFGCYRPAFASSQWLARMPWIEATGDRWWPVFGAAYFLMAVKRVPGMRLIELATQKVPKRKAAPAVATQQHRAESETMVMEESSGVDR